MWITYRRYFTKMGGLQSSYKSRRVSTTAYDSQTIVDSRKS